MFYFIIFIATLLLGQASLLNAQTTRPPVDELSRQLEKYLQRNDIQKKALVIGIEEYKHFDPATNARNDASSIKEALEDIGFYVETLDAPLTLTYDGITTRIQEFAERSLAPVNANPSIVVFYFAGHGFHAGSGNFLVPYDAPSNDTLPDNSITVDSIVDILAPHSTLLIMYLDACRTEFPHDAKHKKFTKPATNGQHALYYGFAANFNEAAFGRFNPKDRNSPFATALKVQVKEKNVELGEVFRLVKLEVERTTKHQQSPIPVPDITGRFFLNPSDQFVQRLEEKWALLIMDSIHRRNGMCIQEFLEDYPITPYTLAAKSWLDLFQSTSALARCSKPRRIWESP